jgi:hemolysin activation/secretion protein
VPTHRLLRFFASAIAAAWLVSAPLIADAQTRFDIQRFIVQGNTLLPEAEVRRLVSPFEGTARDFGDIQRALEALQEAYLGRGYAAVRVLVPEQELSSGQVRIQVIEATLAEVRVEGNRFFSTDNIRRSLPALREGQSPNTPEMSQNVVLVNENPAKQLSIGLEAAKDPGKVDAVVNVSDYDPSRWSLSLDNTGTSSTGYYRTGVGYQNANVGNRDHVLNMQYITSADHIGDVSIFGAGYRVPLYARQGYFDVFGGYSDVNSGTVQNLFTVSGKGTVLGARYTQVLPKFDAYEQRLAFGLDYRALQNNVSLLGTSNSLLPDITVRPASVSYIGRLSQVGRDASVYATYVTNLSGSGDASQDAFSAQRPQARAHYEIARYGASYSDALPGDFLVRASYNAQYTRDRLVPAEQFGMGGVESVRGYFERETASDVGHRVSLEAYSPDFGPRVIEGWRMRGLVFYDEARGYDRIPARVAANEINGLSSVGVGLRMTQGRTLSARMDLAHVLNAAGSRPVGKDRLHFAVIYSF